MEDQILDPNIRAELPQDITSPETPPPWYKNVKIILSSAVALMLILGIAWYFVWGRNEVTAPSSNKVSLTIAGPDNLASGSEGQYVITYRNGEKADLTNVHLDLIYPNSFQFKSSTPPSKVASGQSFDLPILREGKDGQVTIRAKLSGATGEDKQIQAKLRYKLSNFNSTFQVEQNFHTILEAPKLTFELSGPAEVPIGQDTSFKVNYSNVSGQDYDNLALSLSYPENFKFTSSTVPPTKNNNFWQLGKLASGNSGHIDISGSFVGQNMDEQLVSGLLGQMINNSFAPQMTSTATFRLKNAPLGISQESSPASVVNLGDSILFTISYENDSTVGLTNLVITDTFNSSLVETSRLVVPDGVIAGSTITWKAATNKNLSILSPGQKGQVQFSLPLKQSLPATIKNQLIKNSVTITSSEITTPIRAEDVEIKLQGKLGLDVVGDYVSGASPMEVGKSTTFAITFMLSSGSNDISNAQVVASMPLPTSAWTGVVVPDSEKSRLSFDPSSGLIRWDVGTLPAFVGKLTPAAKVTFRLTVTPSESDRGQLMKLLSTIQAEGQDTFTNQKLAPQPIDQFSTADINDDGFQAFGSTVQ